MMKKIENTWCNPKDKSFLWGHICVFYTLILHEAQNKCQWEVKVALVQLIEQ